LSWSIKSEFQPLSITIILLEAKADYWAFGGIFTGFPPNPLSVPTKKGGYASLLQYSPFLPLKVKEE
jgi:hypothetical protein